MVQNPMSGRDPDVTVGVGGDASGFNEAVDSSIGSLNKFKSAVTVASAAVGALGTALTVKAVNAARDFEEQMVEVEKVTSEAIAAELHADIRQMAEEVPRSQEALSNIAAVAGRLGVQGSDNIREFTRVTAEIAVATDLVAKDAADSFARIATLTNEPVSNIRRLGDAVNKLSNTMATSAAEVTEAATRSSGTLTQLGLSTEDILGLNAAMNEVSASARRAGTRLRRMGQELQTVDASAVHEALGITEDRFRELRRSNPNQLIIKMAEAMDKGGESAAILREEFSTTTRTAIAGLAQNLDALRKGQQKANRQMANGGSLAEEFAAANSTFNASLQRLQNRLRNVAISVGSKLLPPLSRGIDAVSDLVADFQELNQRTNGFAGIAATVGAAVGGLGTSAALLASQLGLASSAAGGLTAAVGALTGPIGLVVAGIAALGVAWSQNWGNIRSKTRNVINKIIPKLRNLRKTVVNDIIPPLKKGFKEFVKIAWTNGIKPFLNDMKKLWKAHFIGDDSIVQNTKTAMNELKSLIQGALNLIKGFWQTFGDEITLIVKGVFGTIETAVSIGMDAILTAVNVVLDIISGDFEGALNSIVGFWKRTFNEIKSWLSGSGKQLIKGAIQANIQMIQAIFQGLYDWLIGGSIIKDMILDVRDYLMNTGKSIIKIAFNSLKVAAKTALSYLWGTDDDSLYGDIIGGIKKIKKWLITTGKSMIKDAMGEIKDAVEGAFERAKENIVGNSIVPEMMGDVKSEFSGLETWVRQKWGLEDAVSTVVDGAMNEIQRIEQEMKEVERNIEKRVQNVQDRAEDAEDSVDDIDSGDGGDGGGGDGDEEVPPPPTDPAFDRVIDVAKAENLDRELRNVNPEDLQRFYKFWESRRPGISIARHPDTGEILHKSVKRRYLDEISNFVSKDVMVAAARKFSPDKVVDYVESLQAGGMISESGLAFMHSPELVLNSAETREARDEGVAVGELDVTDDFVEGLQKFERFDQIVRELRRIQEGVDRVADEAGVEIQDTTRYREVRR